MWKYNNTNELYHFGIPGMKWGHRTMTRSQTNRANFKSAKKDYKIKNDQLMKKYGKLEDKMTYGKNSNNSKNNQISKQLSSIEKQMNSNTSAFKNAKNEYKTEKRAIRGDINDAAQRQRHASSFGERLLYNDATRRRAGKLMVEKKMNEMDAVSKAKKEAWRNTGIAALGLMGIAYATRIK